MATFDLTDLATEACYASRRDPTDSDELTRAKRHCNDWIRALYDSDQHWSFLEREGSLTLTASSDTYLNSAVATAFSLTGTLEVLDLVLDDADNSTVLQAMSWEDMERLANSTDDGDATGVPRFWAKFHNRFKVYPSPDEAYTLGVLYRYIPPELTSGTDTTEIPTAWLRKLVINPAAASLMLEESGGEAMNQALYIKSQYEKDLEDFTRRYQSANDQTILFSAPGWNKDLYGVASPLDYSDDY